MMAYGISQATLKRLPLYLSYLKQLGESTPVNISSSAISQGLGLNEVQVRKDLASVSDGGRPKVGYITKDLMGDIEAYLGYNDISDAIIVGAGKLGKALLGYNGFEEYGLKIIAAFDNDSAVVNEKEKIYPIEKLESLCSRLNVKMGIITVPAKCAQDVCNMLVKSGVKAVWNFAPVLLAAPGDVVVQNENLAASFSVLSKHLQRNNERSEL